MLLGRKQNKESSLLYVFIHPILGTGRLGTARSTPGLAPLTRPAQQSQHSWSLQGSGCSKRWGQRAARFCESLLGFGWALAC